MKFSTGLRNGILVTGSVKSQLDGGTIKVYSATTLPADADAAETGTLLLTISLTGTGSGLVLDSTAADGAFGIPSGATWKGTVATSGTANYFRWVPSGDTGASSTTAKRIQGTIGIANADMIWTVPALVSGNEKILNAFTLAFPIGS